jgi:hypothetical protein
MGKHMEMENRTKTIFPNNKIPFMDKWQSFYWSR